MKKLFYTLFFSLISLFSFAQTSLITGRVVIDDSTEGQDALQGILVENEKTHARVVTNEEGLFSINVSLGDLLNFSNDFYEERSVKVSQEMIKKGFIIVHLNIEVVELSEANVSYLDKNWKNNINNKKTEDEELYNKMGLDHHIKDIKVNPNAASVLNGNGVLDPSQWISMISGQKKNAKKQDQYFKEVNKIKDLENYYTKHFFTESLAIPENKVTEFITYCYDKFELEKLVNQNKYERIEGIFKKQAPAYLRNLK